MRTQWTAAERQANDALRARLSQSPDRQAQALRKQGVPEVEVERRHAELVADLVWRARAIAVDTWACPSCSAPYTSAPPPVDPPTKSRRNPPATRIGSYPREHCACGRPYPIRCTSPGCPQVVEPREVRTASDALYDVPNRAGPLIALPPELQCESCLRDAPYRARLRAWSGSQIPAHVRAIAAHSYWTQIDERVTFVAALGRWLDSDLGRGLGACSLYLWGTPGTGKTTGAAHAVYRAFVERGLVPDFTWCSQSQLKAWHDQQWTRDTDRARAMSEQASASWDRVRAAPLLVVDELFAGGCRGAFGERLADLVRDRLEQRQPTVYTSNHPPEWSARIETDGRIDSRWQSHGVTVLMQGHDWRASA
ncbi:MAG: hypothetical protein IT385_18925 [Deltaproteobacteria bacterium]|nr:hypothetical protein [Deltaproteobacteria bacterium]